MKATLRDLRVFLAVAEDLHFGHASLRLGIAQPNLSAVIRKLEADIGTALFERRPRVELTAAGVVLRHGAQEIFDQLGATFQRAKLAGLGSIGVVRVGVASTSMLSALPDALRQFRERNAEVELRLQEMTSTAQWNALRMGEIDVAITRDMREDSDVRRTLLFREPFCVALPVAHRLASGSSAISLHKLARENFVMFRRAFGAPLYDSVLRLCAFSKFTPTVVEEVDELHSVFGIVRVGLGISIVPEALSNVEWPGVTFRKLTRSPVQAELFCCWLRTGLTPATKRFVGHLLAQIDGETSPKRPKSLMPR